MSADRGQPAYRGPAGILRWVLWYAIAMLALMAGLGLWAAFR